MSNPTKNKAWNAPKPAKDLKIGKRLTTTIAAYFWIKAKQNGAFYGDQKEEYCQPICDAAREEGKRATILPGFIIISSKTMTREFTSSNPTGDKTTNWRYRDRNETETRLRLAKERHARREQQRNRRAVKLLQGNE